MSRVSKLGVFLLVGSLVVGTAASTADARPAYCKAFIAKYEKIEEAKTAKCAICHPKGKKKTDRNCYGVAISKLLKKDEKNVKDAKRIEELLKKAEECKSAIEGEKFGEQLKEGKLPACKK